MQKFRKIHLNGQKVPRDRVGIFYPVSAYCIRLSNLDNNLLLKRHVFFIKSDLIPLRLGKAGRV